MSTESREELRQRADYTHKHNLKRGRHGWLRLTPAYSVKMVEELIGQCDRPMRIFDPFSGTATTVLSAAYHGHEGVTADINPFLVWLGEAKTAHYSATAITATYDACTVAVHLTNRRAVAPVPPPPIYNIERWWTPRACESLRRMRGAIETVTAPHSHERNLLLIAFCQTLITLSNAAFNHQSLSFRNAHQLQFELDLDVGGIFTENVRCVLNGATENPKGQSQVVRGDSRDPAAVVEGPFERVITSPPYVNRMSYIRELRPYMYWLGFLTDGRDAGELDWAAIGGTWGVATSRLTDWQRGVDPFRSNFLDEAVSKIADHRNKNGRLLANYVARYFDDMWAHFQGLRPLLAPKGQVHYIVGNSTFYGTLLPVEQIYIAMLDRLGFEGIESHPLRKRNSKRELIEFDVTATWPGGS